MPPEFANDGAQVARHIRERRERLGIILLSQHIEVEHTLELAARGSFGYLLKDRVLDVDDFLDTVDRVARGGTALDSDVVAALIRPARPEDRLARLTPRETQVLQLMAEGRTNMGIAKTLWLSKRTVETHVTGILAKLGITDSPEDDRRVLAVIAYLSAGR